VEKKREGGNSDLWVFSFIESSGDEDWQDFLLNNFVGEDVSLSDSVNLEFWQMYVRAGNNQMLEHVNSVDLDEWIDKFVHMTLNDWDHTRVSNVTEGSHENILPVSIFGVFRFNVFLELFNVVWEEFGFDDLGVTEMPVHGNWVAGVADLSVDTGLVQQGGESKSGGRLDLNILGIMRSGLDKVENFSQELDGWCANVHGQSHDDTGSTFSNDDSIFDHVNQNLDVGICSGNGDGVNDDVTSGFVFLSLLLVGKLMVNLFNITVGEISEDLSNS